MKLRLGNGTGKVLLIWFFVSHCQVNNIQFSQQQSKLIFPELRMFFPHWHLVSNIAVLSLTCDPSHACSSCFLSLSPCRRASNLVGRCLTVRQVKSTTFRKDSFYTCRISTETPRSFHGTQLSHKSSIKIILLNSVNF